MIMMPSPKMRTIGRGEGMYGWVGVGFSLHRRSVSRDRGLWTHVLGTPSLERKLSHPCGTLSGTKVGRHQSCFTGE